MEAIALPSVLVGPFYGIGIPELVISLVSIGLVVVLVSINRRRKKK